MHVHTIRVQEFADLLLTTEPKMQGFSWETRSAKGNWCILINDIYLPGICLSTVSAYLSMVRVVQRIPKFGSSDTKCAIPYLNPATRLAPPCVAAIDASKEAMTIKKR